MTTALFVSAACLVLVLAALQAASAQWHEEEIRIGQYDRLSLLPPPKWTRRKTRSRVTAQTFDGSNALHTGGLFHTMDRQSVGAFFRAIETVNADEYLLPGLRLVGVNLTVPELDALNISSEWARNLR